MKAIRTGGPSAPGVRSSRRARRLSAVPARPVLTPEPARYEELNRYTRIIVDEARQRGIGVEILNPSLGELVLSLGDRQVRTLESLSELTSAVAFKRCDHKPYTREVLQRAGLRVPPGRTATFDDGDMAFLDEWNDIVVKPARGEQGWGVSVGVVDRERLDRGVANARNVYPEVLLEQRCPGEDLRVLVIGDEAVAASVRRPPHVCGTGNETVAVLVEALSRAREADTDGASRIPLDDTTLDVVRRAGYEFDTIVPEGTVVPVRRTANLHTGGTITDVTDSVHPPLLEVAVDAAQAIGAPVLGIDMMVPRLDGPVYAIIEVNEQPGLANHEPQPTVERFVDLLFPETSDRI
jgi:GNAT-family acetyltransferase (TIGR03103 family)